MSLSIFNAVPAGFIEVLTDANDAPHFKRADLGRFLGIVDIKTSMRNVNVATKSRSEIVAEIVADEKDMQIALLDDDLTESQNIVRHLEYHNTGMQGEIRAKDQQIAHLQQQYVPLLEDESKNYGITIIAKNDESVGYPFISICGQHGYRRQKKRVVLLKNPGSTEFADGPTPNAIVTYNVWREHGLIETDPARPRDFRLVNIENEQLLRIV